MKIERNDHVRLLGTDTVYRVTDVAIGEGALRVRACDSLADPFWIADFQVIEVLDK